MPSPGLPGFWGAQQWSRFTKESVWGAFDAAATIKPFVDIEPGGLNLERTPITVTGRVATTNIPGRRASGKYTVTGTYKTKMFPRLMHDFIPWACSPSVVAGKLTLPSFTIDWYDGQRPRRFRGVRVPKVTLEFTNDAQWGMATFDLQGMDEDSTPPTFPEPVTAGTYPVVEPYIHQNTATFCLLNGAAITGYRALKITYTNILDPQFDEFRTLNSLDYCGRDIDWSIVRKVQDTVGYTVFENQTPVTGFLKWTVTSTETTPVIYTNIFDLKAANYIDPRTVERDFGKVEYETLNFKTFRDPTTMSDGVATTTAA